MLCMQVALPSRAAAAAGPAAAPPPVCPPAPTRQQGLRKPSPEAYAAALAHLGVPPSRLLFVDDRQANVDGALAAGIAAIRFESAAQLEAELRARGVPLG